MSIMIQLLARFYETDSRLYVLIGLFCQEKGRKLFIVGRTVESSNTADKSQDRDLTERKGQE